MTGSQIPHPLAEGRWLWRRLYVFAASTALWALLAVCVRRAMPTQLPQIAEGLMGLLALLLVLYWWPRRRSSWSSYWPI